MYTGSVNNEIGWNWFKKGGVGIRQNGGGGEINQDMLEARMEISQWNPLYK
jgi:hypothetical protein